MAQGQGPQPRPRGAESSFGELACQELVDHPPVQDVIVHRIDRDALIKAMGAFVDRADTPAPIDIVNGHALGPEEAAIARAGGHANPVGFPPGRARGNG